MDKKVEIVNFSTKELPRMKNVAAYARVSTGKDEMLHSLSAQVSYYSDFIQRHKGWQFGGVFSDEAITGTKDIRSGFQKLLTECRDGNIDMVITKSISRFARKRDGFNEMISDALSGKIDLIITKSVSRFTRNTLDSLSTIRKLKENGTEVYFEKENIWTFDGKGELLITIMSSLAQEES